MFQIRRPHYGLFGTRLLGAVSQTLYLGRAASAPTSRYRGYHIGRGAPPGVGSPPQIGGAPPPPLDAPSETHSGGERHATAIQQRLRRDRPARRQSRLGDHFGRHRHDRQPAQAQRCAEAQGGDRPARRPAALHHQHRAARRSLDRERLLRCAGHRARRRAHAHPRDGFGGALRARRHLRAGGAGAPRRTTAPMRR